MSNSDNDLSTADNFREEILKQLYRCSPGIPGNDLEDVIRGASYKPWYKRAYDYVLMGGRLLFKQYIWSGKETFRRLSGTGPLMDVGISNLKDGIISSECPQPSCYRPKKIEVFVVTTDVDNHQTLVLANRLPRDLNYISQEPDYKYIFEDYEKRIGTDHAAHATAALPCFERPYIPNKEVLKKGEYATRCLDGAATCGLMTQIVNDNSILFLINLNESTETRPLALSTNQKPKYQTGGLRNYAFNSFMTMLYNNTSMDVRWALENDNIQLDQYIEIKPSMQSSPENRDMQWGTDEPLTTLDFLKLTEDVTKKAFWFGYDITKKRLEYIVRENKDLAYQIDKKGVTLVMSGGGARGAILSGAVFAFVEMFGPGVIKCMGGTSMGGIIAIMMAKLLSNCPDFVGERYEPHPPTPDEFDDRM